jgi:hypothetical protein
MKGSGRSRLIMMLAVTLSVVALAVAGMLLRPINQMRRDLQLTVNPDVYENMPPELSITAAMGAFRGLAVDVMWGRANRLKEAGRFHEAMQLSEWITKLQPRFAQVWAFHSWNMAYNISVATRTEAERWMWVQAGIRLLRDEGIPLNPQNTQLYRELSWIFLHKIGMYSDDMHWYYKAQLADRWHSLLGRPPAGETKRRLAWFEPIAVMDERYASRDFLTRGEQERWTELTAQMRPDPAEEAESFASFPPGPFTRRVPEWMYEADLSEAQREHVRQLVDQIVQRIEAAGGDPQARLLKDQPELREPLNRLRAIGFELNAALLQAVTDVQVLIEALQLGLIEEEDINVEDDRDLQLRQWLEDSEIEAARDDLLAFTRARVLRSDYHMAPTYMFQLMREQGPVDWRHPAAHGLYWASLGVKVGQRKLAKSDDYYFQLLNTSRNFIHAIQALTHNGRINYDPLSGYYSQLPEPAFIEAYERARYGVGENIGGIYAESGAPESFEAGHENFLIWALHLHYLYGERSDARAMYRRLQETYGQKAQRAERYSQPLDEFVLSQVKENLVSLDDARQLIAGLLHQAVQEGLAVGNVELAAQRLAFARRCYEFYQDQQDYEVFGAQRHRMKLPPFIDLAGDVLASALLAPSQPGSSATIIKARIWDNAPDDLRRHIFDRVRPLLYQEARLAGLDPTAAFAPPPGIQTAREQRGRGEADQDPAEDQPQVEMR